MFLFFIFVLFCFVVVWWVPPYTRNNARIETQTWVGLCIWMICTSVRCDCVFLSTKTKTPSTNAINRRAESFNYEEIAVKMCQFSSSYAHWLLSLLVLWLWWHFIKKFKHSQNTFIEFLRWWVNTYSSHDYCINTVLQWKWK